MKSFCWLNRFRLGFDTLLLGIIKGPTWSWSFIGLTVVTVSVVTEYVLKFSTLSQLLAQYPQNEEVRCGCDYTGQENDLRLMAGSRCQ